jgi:hypothetical protein
MTIWNRLSKALSVMALAAILLAAAAIWDNSTSRVSAFNPQPDPPALGMLGITPEQTARLNVINWGDRSGPIPSGDRPVQVELSFFDSQGNLLLRSTETLMEGHAAFLDLNGATLFPSGDVGDAVGLSNRAEIRGGVQVLGPIPEPDRNTLNLVPTLEVFDNFGPDAGKSRMGWTSNHNETLVRDTARAKSGRR